MRTRDIAGLRRGEEGGEDKEEEERTSRFLLATLGDTANAPAALERCLSSASCNKSTTLDPKSALRL